MPKRKKQKAEQEVELESESSEEEESEESSISTELVQADFEAFAPTEQDFVGVRNLLQQLLLKASINVNELTELIIQQSHVGCVHKVANDDSDEAMDSNDDDVYGVVTVVDFGADDKECISQLKGILRKRCNRAFSKSPNSGPTAITKAAFDQLWRAGNPKRTGWIINERLINIPFQIALPSFENLKEELEAGDVKYDSYMAILKIHKMDSPRDSGGASTSVGSGQTGKAKAKKRNKKKNAANSDSVIFANSEEELLSEECEYYFDYCVSDETEGGILGDRRTEEGFYKPYRRVVLIDQSIFDKFLTKLKSIVDA